VVQDQHHHHQVLAMSMQLEEVAALVALAEMEFLHPEEQEEQD
jgi:hypothetical protein